MSVSLFGLLAPLALLPSFQSEAEAPAGEWPAHVTWEPAQPIAALRFLDVDGDGSDELLCVEAAGRVQILKRADDWSLQPLEGELQLPDPSRCLLDMADLLQTGQPQLIVLDGGGLRAHELGAAGIGGAQSIARRARLQPRTGVPSFADFVRRLSSEDESLLPDVIVPAPYVCQLWRLEPPAEEGPGVPRARKVAELLSRHASSRAFEANRLSDLLRSNLTIPNLATEDLNGDGREDLVIESGDLRSFYLQGEDGRFAAEPSLEVDLEIFKDTSPEAEVRPGEIVTDDDTRNDNRRDLDNDGIPDHVIAHRRKVWVFHGDENGPQYSEPSTVLKVAENVTGLVVVRVDEDEYPDLVLLKVEVPGIAELVVGVLGEWDVSLRVIGYRNEGGRRFATKPTWRVEHELTLPPILDVVRRPERFFEDFEDLRASVRAAAQGDWDGDGELDLILAKADGKDARPWLGNWSGRGTAVTESESSEDEDMRRLIFENENTSWNLERLASTFSSLTADRLDSVTGGASADSRSATLEDWELENLAASDMDGDGADELVVLYRKAEDARRVRLELRRVGP